MELIACSVTSVGVVFNALFTLAEKLLKSSYSCSTVQTYLDSIFFAEQEKITRIVVRTSSNDSKLYLTPMLSQFLLL